MKTLNNDIEEYIKEKSSYLSPKTIKYYSDCLRYFSKYENTLNHFNVDDLMLDDLINYQLYLRNTRIKNTSVNTYMRGVRAYISFRGYDCKMPKRCRDDSNQIVVLTQDEVDRIDKEIENTSNRFPGLYPVQVSLLELRNKLIVHLMIDNGLRLKECVNLNLSDIDIANMYMIVRNSKYNKDRFIPLSEKVKTLLSEYYMLIDSENYELDKALLYDYQFNHRITENAIKQIFYKLKKKTGIKNLHAHILRHTFGTAYILQGGDVSLLQLIMGHSSISVTEKYLHFSQVFRLSHVDVYRISDNMLRR